MRALPGLEEAKGEAGGFGSGRPPLRRKAVAVLASLLLHAAGLAGVVLALRGPDVPPAGPRTALVTVALRPDTPPQAYPPQQAEVRAKVPHPAAARHPVPAVAAREAPPAVSPVPDRAPADSAPPVDRMPVAPALTGVAAPEVRQAPADGLEDYRIRLWRRILASRPQGARGAGRVLVRFRIDRQGRLLFAEIAQSSGLFQLDRLALRAIHAAAPFEPPPAGVEESRLTFAVPIDFHG